MKKTTLKYLLLAAMIAAMALCFAACGSGDSGDADSGDAAAEGTTLVYGSNDYTRINPAIDEHGEINLLLFDGLMGHDETNAVVPALAESYDLDEDTNTYTFHLREGVTWHDGEPFTANDVKFTTCPTRPARSETNRSNCKRFFTLTSLRTSRSTYVRK